MAAFAVGEDVLGGDAVMDHDAIMVESLAGAIEWSISNGRQPIITPAGWAVIITVLRKSISGPPAVGFIPPASCTDKDSCHRHGECMYRGVCTITPALDAAIQDEIDHPPKDIMK